MEAETFGILDSFDENEVNVVHSSGNGHAFAINEWVLKYEGHCKQTLTSATRAPVTGEVFAKKQ